MINKKYQEILHWNQESSLSASRLGRSAIKSLFRSTASNSVSSFWNTVLQSGFLHLHLADTTARSRLRWWATSAIRSFSLFCFLLRSAGCGGTARAWAFGESTGPGRGSASSRPSSESLSMSGGRGLRMPGCEPSSSESASTSGGKCIASWLPSSTGALVWNRNKIMNNKCDDWNTLLKSNGWNTFQYVKVTLWLTKFWKTPSALDSSQWHI